MKNVLCIRDALGTTVWYTMCTNLNIVIARAAQAIRYQLRQPIRWRFVIAALVVLSGIVTLGIAVGDPVYAFPSSMAEFIQWVVSGIASIIFAIAQLVMRLTFFVLKFFIVLAGYNGFSNAPIVNLGWTLVRDLANMYFIVALLVIAFATILGREDYALKKTLVKLVLMAIFINFSKLISQVIIDAAHVVTMTFLNALSAIAGGNLIQMFNMDDMRSMITTSGDNPSGQEDLHWQLLGASFLTVLMSFTALFIIGVYMIIILYRMVTLWVLIILSPIAYAAAALPASAGYAREWWQRFTSNVMSAPVMCFFLWLAFATIGNGAVLEQITEDRSNSLPRSETSQFAEEAASANLGGGESTGELAVSASEATTWTNMAGFAVAVAFLYAGIEAVQKMGVEGSNYLGKAKDLGMSATKMTALGAGFLATAGQAGRVKDYAKIAGYRMKNVYDGTLNKGSLRRKAAIEKAKKLNEMKREQIKSTPSNKPWSITNALAPDSKTIARQKIRTENAVQDSENRSKAAEGDLRIDQFKKNREVYEAELSKLRKEKLEELGRPLSLKEESTLMQQAAEAAGPSKFKKFFGAQAGIAERAYATEDAQAKMNKAGDEAKIVAATLGDAQRMSSGKLPKKLRLYQDAEFQDDVKEFATMDFDQRMVAFQRELEQVRALRAKGSTKGIKQMQRNLSNIMTSAAEQGELNDLLQYGALDSMEGDWQGWNNPENKQKLVMSILSGRNQDMNSISTEDLQTDQRSIRENMADKYDGHARALRRSFNMFAKATGDTSAKDMWREGVDEDGQRVVALSDSLMAGQRGDNGVISSGFGDKTGQEKRVGKQDFMRRSFDRLRDIQSAYSVFSMNDKGQAIDFHGDSDEAREAIEGLIDEIGDYSVAEMRGMQQEMFNVLSGGSTIEKGTVTGGVLTGLAGDEKENIREKVNQLVQRKIDRLENTDGVTEQRRTEELEELYYRLTGERRSRAMIETLMTAGGVAR